MSIVRKQENDIGAHSWFLIYCAMWLLRLRSQNIDMMLGSTVFNYNYQCACCLYSFVCVHPLQGTLEGVGPGNQQFLTPEWQRAKRMSFGPKKVEIYLLCTTVPDRRL